MLFNEPYALPPVPAASTAAALEPLVGQAHAEASLHQGLYTIALAPVQIDGIQVLGDTQCFRIYDAPGVYEPAQWIGSIRE